MWRLELRDRGIEHCACGATLKGGIFRRQYSSVVPLTISETRRENLRASLKIDHCCCIAAWKSYIAASLDIRSLTYNLALEVNRITHVSIQGEAYGGRQWSSSSMFTKTRRYHTLRMIADVEEPAMKAKKITNRKKNSVPVQLSVQARRHIFLLRLNAFTFPDFEGRRTLQFRLCSSRKKWQHAKVF